MSRQAALALLVAALALQAAIAALGLPLAGRNLAGDEQTYTATATQWAAGHPVELDPLWPPGYPALLAGWLALGGTLLGFFPLQVLAHLAAAALLGALAFDFAGEGRVAALATALFALDPQIAAFAQTFWPETIHLALLLALLRFAARGIETTAGAVAFGAGAATALLLKSLLTPFVPLLAVGAFLADRRAPWRARLRRAATALCVFALLLTPVAMRNQRRHGFWGIADSTRFNLLLGLGDRSPRSLRDDRAHAFQLAYRSAGESFREREEYLAAGLRREVASRGLFAILAEQLPRQYFRLFDRESYFTAMLPESGALAAQGQGFRDPPRALAAFLAGYSTVLYAVVLAAAPLGLGVLALRRPRGLWLVLAFLTYQLALFALFHVKARYRLPMLPWFDLPAAVAIVALADRLRGSPREPWPLGLRLGALAGGLSLLALGFGAGVVG